MGFLPAKAKARGDALAEVAGLRASLIFYESGPRCADSLASMAEVLGDRPAALCREISKLHEEVLTDTLSALAAAARAKEPRGEVVIVVGPPARRHRRARVRLTRRWPRRWRACRCRRPLAKWRAPSVWIARRFMPAPWT